MKKLAEIYPPLSFIVEEMQERGWSKEVLQRQTGLSYERIERIFNGESIGKSLAIVLGRTFGTSTDYWLNLQAIWNIALEIAIEEELCWKSKVSP